MTIMMFLTHCHVAQVMIIEWMKTMKKENTAAYCATPIL